MQLTKTSHVALDARGITINGRREIILCASLFYFRIPEGSWEDRMGKIKLAGYNCIDVYFPWNFHELQKDEWDLQTGMRDVERFLTLAEKYDLYVMARPGPYICSEWDGGSLPAYLFGEDIPIRQNNTAYLERVEEWYSRILPIIARHQIDEGGSVVIFQIENELDFFACDDVPGYISALADSARSHGITVPIFACAGQGDIYGAWGSVDDVAPAMNLYLDSKIPQLEQSVSTYTKLLSNLDTPLMVTEMGRDNLLMRRYLASGAKLLGPYNQVSGYDFGFTESINNWGDPVLFLPSYYDFHSLISPFGQMRDFIADDRVLSAFMKTMGGMLAGAVINDGRRYELASSSNETSYPSILSLDSQEGAELVCVNNLSDQADTFALGTDETITVRLPSYTSLFVLSNIDLSIWGIPAFLNYATAEPIFQLQGNEPVIIWTAPIEGEVQLTISDKLIEFTFDANSETRLDADLPDGRTLTLIGIGRDLASRVTGYEDGTVRLLNDEYYKISPTDDVLRLSYYDAATSQEQLFDHGVAPARAAQTLELEKNGMLRGYGMYSVTGVLNDPLAIVLHNAADIVSVYAHQHHIATRFPAGCNEIISLSDSARTGPQDYEVRAEIWGHSNFDDDRKPAIRISSLRGISAMTEIRDIRALHIWRTDSPAGGSIPYYTGFGRHLTTERPSRTSWYQRVEIGPEDDSSLIEFDGIECDAEIEVDGKLVGHADQFSHVVDITSAVAPGKSSDITVHLTKRHYDESGGAVRLLLGKRLRTWQLRGLKEKELIEDAAESASTKQSLQLPLHLAPGEVRWIYGSQLTDGRFGDHSLTLDGVNCKATLIYNGVICGRLFLPTEGAPIARDPKNGNKFFAVGYVPGCWSRERGNEFSLFVEAIGNEDAVLQSIEVTAIS